VATIIRDGPLTGGLAYEAISHAGKLRSPLAVIPYDNQMSISPNRGGLVKYLSSLRMGPVVVHGVTRKGKGYQFADKGPGSYYAVPSFSISGGFASKEPAPEEPDTGQQEAVLSQQEAVLILSR
jgi:deoxyxylulose-5-phosphate synthase